MRFFSLLAMLCLLTVAAADRPNIILLMGDDHGWAETGYYGHPHLKTPVMDEMARKGLRLDHFYAGHPSCSPTRGSVLTGRHPNRYGTFAPGYSLRPQEITIAHLLAKAGYLCGHFGKWHVGPVKKSSPTNPRAMGFHEYVSHDNFYEMDPPFSRNGGLPVVIKGEGSEVTIDETLRFIEDAKKREAPFLAVVWFGSPHEPYSGLAKDLALYDNLPKEYAERKVRLTSNETGRPTQRPLLDVLRERYAEITAMDRAIGKLRTRLAELNLRDNTVLWYCGDNGSPRSYGRVVTPFRAEKGSVYEGGIRVPGLIEWPAKIKKGRVSKVNGVTSDMLPTLCTWAGVEPPARPLDGISLAPLVEGKMNARPKPIGFWSFNSRRATRDGAKPYLTAAQQQGTTPLVKFAGNIRTRNFRNYHQPPIEAEDFGGSRVWLDNRYKLVIPAKAGAAPELYDLQKEPAEETNLAEKHSDRTARMSRELRSWQSSVLNSLRERDYSDSWGKATDAVPEFYAASDVPESTVALTQHWAGVAAKAWGNFGPVEFWVVGKDVSAAKALDEKYCAVRKRKDPKYNVNHCAQRGHNFVQYATEGQAGLNTRRNENELWSGFLITMAAKNPSPAEDDYKVVVMHEMFHVYQHAHIHSRNWAERRALTGGNAWWMEGGAEYMAQLLYSRQPGVRQDYLLDKMKHKLQSSAKLREGESIRDIPYGRRGNIGYDLGAWFVAYVIHKTSEEAFRVGFYRDLNAKGFEGAFKKNFGKSSKALLGEFHNIFLKLPPEQQLKILPNK